MKSYPTPGQVFDDLGDKVLGALVWSVDQARTDLTTYRAAYPLWVADASERGLASWIHDRLWAHLTVALVDVDSVTLLDKEPTREISVGTNYQLRMKRHHEDGAVSTYPTQGAIEFMAQDEGQLSLVGLGLVKLIAGYNWNKDSRDMGVACLSLRDGKDNVVWHEDIPTALGGQTGGAVVRPVAPQPTPPRIDATPLRPGETEETNPE